MTRILMMQWGGRTHTWSIPGWLDRVWTCLFPERLPDSICDVEVFDATGDNRVALYFKPVLMQLRKKSIGWPKPVGFEFHSLVWETKNADHWNRRAVITADDFQRGRDRRRWIVDVYSFDPHSGLVVAKIAEEDSLPGSDWIAIDYSWRELDLVNRSESRTIRQCMDPLEPF